MNNSLSSLNSTQIDSFRLKKARYAKINIFKVEHGRAYKQSVKKIVMLRESGILDRFHMNNTALVQTVNSSETMFLGLQSPKPGISFYVITGSTSNNLRSAIGNVPGEYDTITGMCLFGAGIDRGLTSSGNLISIVDIADNGNGLGETIVEIRMQSGLSLYEVEKVLRFSHFFRHMGHLGRDRFLFVPRIQYYLYLAPAYCEGLITPETYLKWIEAVRNRAQKITTIFEKRIGSDVRIIQSPLASIEDYLISQIKSNQGEHCLSGMFLTGCTKSINGRRCSMSSLRNPGRT